MKKKLFSVLAMALAVSAMTGCSVIGVSGKNGATEDSLTNYLAPGTYHAISCSDDEGQYICDDDAVVIRENGDAVFVFNGDDYQIVDWSVTEDQLWFQDETGDDFYGEISGSYIEGTLIEKFDYVFLLEGVVESEKTSGKDHVETGIITETSESDMLGVIEPIGEDEGIFTRTSISVDASSYTFLDAVACESEAGVPVIRLYYSYTNGSKDLSYAMSDISLVAYQAGKELDENLNIDARLDTAWSYTQPGIISYAAAEFEYTPDYGMVTIKVVGWWADDPLLEIDIDPAKLPAELDGGEYSLEPIPEPSYIENEGLERSGDVSGVHVKVNKVAECYAQSGYELARVSFDFTNNTSSTASASWNITIRAFQDGVELSQLGFDLSAFDVEEAEENFYKDVEPGETISCATNFILRSDSPIEFVVYDMWGDDPYVGAVVTIDGTAVE